MPLAGVEELCAKRKLPAKFTTNGEEEKRSSYAAATTSLPKTPLFITWKMLSSPGRLDLRGCIGTFDPKPLETGLKDYALTAYVVTSLKLHGSPRWPDS
jgi:AMMECR1 domain-containing protein